ncbi:MAG: hypothetical protein ACP5OJ_00985 [Methanothermobacter sp.]
MILFRIRLLHSKRLLHGFYTRLGFCVGGINYGFIERKAQTSRRIRKIWMSNTRDMSKGMISTWKVEI